MLPSGQMRRDELITTAIILGLTTLVAMVYYNPAPEARVATAEARLDHIRQLVIAHNAKGTDYTGADFSQLPGLDPKDRLDPWGNPFRHDVDGGFVYSLGPKGASAGPQDWIKLHYRMPGAYRHR